MWLISGMYLGDKATKEHPINNPTRPDAGRFHFGLQPTVLCKHEQYGHANSLLLSLRSVLLVKQLLSSVPSLVALQTTNPWQH